MVCGRAVCSGLVCILLACFSVAQAQEIGLSADEIFSTCGVTTGCYYTPDECSGSDCDYLVSWKPDGEYTDFAVSAIIDPALGDDQYMSIGFNPTGLMTDASVIDCIMYGGNFSVWSSYNDGYTNSLLEDPLEGLDPEYSAGAVVDNHMSCNYRRITDPGDDSLLDNLESPNQYYLIIAQGAAESPVSKVYHTTRLSSSSEISFFADTVESGEATDPYFKAHAVLMTIAWGFLAGFGLLNARFYKGEWKGQTACGLAVWFANHRHALVLTTLLTIAGTIVILYRVGSYIKLECTPAILEAHPPIGMTVLFLAIINPIMSIFRGGKDAKFRWLFNYVHRAVGETALILGYVNILLGMKLPATGSIATGGTFWLMVVYGILHACVEVILFLMDHVGKKKENEETTKLNKDPEGGVTSKWLSRKQYVLGLYCVIGLVIVTVVCFKMGTA